MFHSSDFIDETKNVRSFGITNLWAGIGGYVGMILGFSFLQVPDIVSRLIRYAKSKALISKRDVITLDKNLEHVV